MQGPDNNMRLIELHEKLHKMAHPFEHMAHGGLVVVALLIAKLVAEVIFFVNLHLSILVILGSFILTTLSSLFVERKYLKKKIRKLKRKL